MGMVELINLMAAAAAFAAAYLWWSSTHVKVRYDPKPDESGWTSAAITIDDPDGDIDYFDSQRASVLINRKAALAAGLAAGLQGIAFLAPQIAALLATI